jgi:methylenetetrahydrofolate reductase (NADPH)
MRVAPLYDRGRPVFSFEFFPPKTEKGVEALFRTLSELAPLAPDFVSVTCPLDKQRRPQTFALVARIKRELGIEAVAHLVTVDYTRAEVESVLRELRDAGIENVLALRGDLPPGTSPDAPRDFPHAADLARLAQRSGFCVGGAAHPELHPESKSWADELRYAAEKVRAGCQFLVTQLFFDCADYFRYVEQARQVGIGVPIVPGIMPVGSVPGIKRMAAQNRNRIPEPFLAELEAAADDDAAVHRLGVRHATAQCVELLARGVPGIHFYTLNKSPATREILTAMRSRG